MIDSADATQSSLATQLGTSMKDWRLTISDFRLPIGVPTNNPGDRQLESAI
jgi:hypothetical protein